MTGPRRVLVAGISGAGKTTLARKLSTRWELPRYELDALHHGPKWVPRPEFESDVRRFAARDSWVTEDQYHGVLGDLLWEHADTVIWLDMPRSTVMWRCVRRSVFRALTRAELWNGNRERWRDWLRPSHPIRWAWSQAGSRRRVTAERAERFPDVTVVRLRTARQARRWLASSWSGGGIRRGRGPRRRDPGERRVGAPDMPPSRERASRTVYCVMVSP